MKKILLFLALALAGKLSMAQYVITGKVYDSANSQPLVPATVAMDQQTGIITIAEGAFRFENVSPGTHVINVRFLGYSTLDTTVVVTSSMHLDIALRKQVFTREPVEITATRAHSKSAMTYTLIEQQEIEKLNAGKDIPFLLESVPSLIATSDAGNGVGYTGLRLRGSDASRINVTVDGIPLNDSESQLLYWVDLPDLASSVENIQVQRGVGTSTNGAGAFGGSINIQTSKPPAKAFLNTSAAYGSFNTLKTNATIGTGLIDNKWNFEGRLSKITSDGYIDRATSDLKSFYISGAYYGKHNSIRMQVISGKEVTYQSWYGVPEASLDTNRTWNFYTYDNQVDDYQQDHYRLFYTHSLSDKLSFNTAFHYTYGRGFYEEYKEEESLSDYLLAPVITGSDTILYTDLIRRKWLNNDFYGVTWSLDYSLNTKSSLVFGGGWNQYDGDHYGEVIWAEFASTGNNKHRYYFNNGLKTDFNAFAKLSMNITSRFDLFADLQYRHVGYDFTGIDDNGNELPQTDKLDFINPKAGITYTFQTGHFAYVSFATGNKEPSRDDYTETTINSRPKPERLYDFEGGYNLRKKKFSVGFNYFMMIYDNQLVLTGEINDVGNYTRTNIKNSYRQGIEIEAGYSPVEKLSFRGNASFSQHKIDKFSEYIDDYDTGVQQVQIHKNTDIAFSPGVTAYFNTTWKPVKNLELSLTNRYVGKQYLDNTSNENRTLDPFFVNDFRLSYSLKPKFMQAIEFSLLASNIFDEVYESNGYTFSYVYGGEKITENYYYPQAGRSFMGMVTLKF